MTTGRRRFTAAALAVAACCDARCVHEPRRVRRRPPQPPTVPPQSSPSPVPTGRGSSADAMARLCIAPKPGEWQAEGGRRHPGRHRRDRGPGRRPCASSGSPVPVAVNPIDDATMDRKLAKAFDQTYPVKFYARRTEAWRTIGVIPPTADIRESLLAFQTGQIVGFYNPADGELVYLSGGDVLDSLTERVILAHELTHAIDDQHFDLTRIDDIVASCDDETFQAALGAVEGSAQHFAFAVATEFPGGTVDQGGGGLPTGVPPFITQLQLWPYTAGQLFIDALDRRGGVRAVNGAIDTFPALDRAGDPPRAVSERRAAAGGRPGPLGEARRRLARPRRDDGGGGVAPDDAAAPTGSRDSRRRGGRLGRRYLPSVDRRRRRGGRHDHGMGFRARMPRRSPRRPRHGSTKGIPPGSWCRARTGPCCSASGPTRESTLSSLRRLHAVGRHHASSDAIRRSVCRAIASKSRSACRSCAPASITGTAMRQSERCRTVSPALRHERYTAAARSNPSSPSQLSNGNPRS